MRLLRCDKFSRRADRMDGAAFHSAAQGELERHFGVHRNVVQILSPVELDMLVVALGGHELDRVFLAVCIHPDHRGCGSRQAP